MSRASEIIFKAIDEVNAILPQDKQLSKEAKAPLLGGENGLDSLDLVHLIVSIEKEIKSKENLEINLTTDQAFSQNHSPFKNVETLEQFLIGQLEAAGE